jgi:hypothetical protein
MLDDDDCAGFDASDVSGPADASADNEALSV